MSRRDSKEDHNLYEVLETLNEGSQPSEPRSVHHQETRRISLQNFDPYCQSSYFLNSPLSIEACKVQGIEEWELLVKTAEDFRKEHIPPKFREHQEEFLELKAQYYEKCRLVRLQNCLEARKKLATMRTSVYQTKEYASGGQSYRSYKDETNLSLITSPKKVIETGRKQLTAMKRKQVHEIEIIMETEKTKEMLDMRMEDHMQRVNEIRESKRAEFERREREAQEEKVKREQRKVELEEQRQRSLQKRRLNSSCMEDHDDKGNMSLLDNSIRIYSARGHTSSRSKSKYLLTNETLDRRCSTVMNAEEKRKQFEEQRHNEKMQRSGEQKKRFDSDRKRMLEQRRVSLETKQGQMIRAKSVKEEETTVERERRYLNKLEMIKNNKQRIAEEKEFERREKNMREAEHLHQIRTKVKEGERELELRNQYLFEELEADLSRAEQQKKEVLGERRQLHMLNYLKEEEAKGNMMRKEKMLKYQEERIGERISARAQRMTSRSRERESITKENQSIIKEFSKERVELKEEFSQLKKKIDKDHYNKYYASPSQLSTFRSGYTCRSESSTKYLKSRPRSPEQKDSARDRRNTLNGLNESGSFSTPNKKARKSHTRSGSKSLLSSGRRFHEEQSSMGVSINTSYDMKDKNLSIRDLKNDFTDTERKIERKIVDEEATLLAGKAFSIRTAKRIGIEDLIGALNNEMQAQAKTQGGFKRSAEAILNTIRLHNEYIENLMHETNYLDLPWAAPKPNKA